MLGMHLSVNMQQAWNMARTFFFKKVHQRSLSHSSLTDKKGRKKMFSSIFIFCRLIFYSTRHISK
jgi:hypothetical protein